MRKRTFKRVYQGEFCTYICHHKNITAASKAIFEMKPKMVENESELFDFIPSKKYFVDKDFTCITSSGCLVPLEAIIDAAATEVDPTGVCEVAKQMAVSVQEEISKMKLCDKLLAGRLVIIS